MLLPLLISSCLVWLVHGQNLDNNTACSTLAREYPDLVSFPDSLAYEALQDSYFVLQARLNPRCVFSPRTAHDVSGAVKILAGPLQEKFAIKSGGHSTNRGFANTEDGITIEFGAMNKVSLSNDRKIAFVEPGATWKLVSEHLDQVELAVVGGRVGSVGVGGLVTGGGISGFSRERGWACDNVVNFEVVLASGAIVDANASSNPDLFRALKGASNNLGIVTRLDLITHSRKPFLAGSIIYTEEAKEASIQAFQDFKGQDTDVFEETEQSYFFNSSSLSIIIIETLWYSNSDNNPNGLQRWEAIQPQISNTLRISNMTDFVSEVDQFIVRGQFTLYSTTTFKITPTILPKILGLWETAINDTFAAEGMDSTMTWQSIPAVAKDTPNILGFDQGTHPETDLVLILVAVFWRREDQTQVAENRALALIDDIDTTAAEEGVGVDFKYYNYALSGQRVIQGYGEESQASLQDVAHKYDPNGVFQDQVAGGFKLN